MIQDAASDGEKGGDCQRGDRGYPGAQPADGGQQKVSRQQPVDSQWKKDPAQHIVVLRGEGLLEKGRTDEQQPHKQQDACEGS